MTHFFVSYAKKDTRKLALALNAALNALPGVTSWLDTSLRAGKSWETQIQAEIRRCDFMIVFYSSDINRHLLGEEESYVLTEIAYAKYTIRKPIIPVMAQKTDPPLSLTTTQYIDYIGRRMTPDDLVTAVCDEAGITRTVVHGQDVVTGFSKEPKEAIRRDMSQTTSFGLLDDQILFTRNFANKDECNWQGIGGQVVGLNGSPLLNMRVRVVGAGGTEKFAISGWNILYGEAGWEIPLNSYLTNNSYLIELYSQDGTSGQIALVLEMLSIPLIRETGL